MSTDKTDSGWRKRQIALDKKAENARELGLDYEPDKTIIEMARQAGFIDADWNIRIVLPHLKAFAKRVREDEREKFCAVLRQLHDSYSLASDPSGLRARGEQA
jgi:hypothetical protein